MAEGLVTSGLHSVMFAVDGATQETYGTYRKGGHLELVLENIRTIVRAKRRNGSLTPCLTIRFIVMKHNEKELPLIKQLAKELDVDFLTIRVVTTPMVFDEHMADMFLPENLKYRKYRIENAHEERKHFTCMRPWKRVTLSSEGCIISCEFDHKDLHPFGNVQTGKSIVSIWKGKQAREFRRMFHAGANDFYHCKKCNYKKTRLEECTIERMYVHSEPETSSYR